jgi:short-subunit dehydrogenase
MAINTIERAAQQAQIRRGARVLGIGALGAAVLGLLAWSATTTRRRSRLAGKTVLITGGSRGLGLAMAEEFLLEGCNVAICARDQDELRVAREHLNSFAKNIRPVLTVACDIKEPDQVTRMIEHVTAKFGAIDVLVNNAGIIQMGPVQSMRLEDFHEAMDINFWGTVHCTLAVLPQMQQRRSGRVVNITSIGGKISVPHLVPYSCSKFAAVAFSLGLRAELARQNISVTTIVPGLMRTGSHLNATFKGDSEAEYSWFSMAAAFPAFNVSARQAARKIVAATREAKSEVIIGWQALAASKLNGLFPGIVAEALSIGNRLLPDDQNTHRQKLGRESETAVSRSPLTALGRRAAQRYNENLKQRA